MRIGSGMALAGTLLLASPSSAQEERTAPLAVGQSVAGELTPNDRQRRTGKYEDVYVVRARQGERIDLRLSSGDFDAYLVVTGPDGFSLSNDDAAEDSLDSGLVVEFPANGDYRVSATTFRPGETGSYRLAAARPAADAAVTRAEPAVPIALGAVVNGRLAPGDGRLASGEFTDRYRFTGRRGQRIRAELTAGKFDTYLILRRPDGSQDDNDDRVDGAETSTNSRIDTVLAEDGEYVLVVTSYQPGETGDYRLALAPSPGLARQRGVLGGPRVLALLVGVSDYGGRTSNLPNTDRDAEQLFGSLRATGLLHPASQLLVNEQATAKGISDAFRRAAAQAGPDDLFLFFFSGHGDQIDVTPSIQELDGRSETIELRDTAMTDAELAPLFAQVRSRMALAVIDACYSGGFRNLVDRPNVMGLFSSEEDLTSLVADRFKAGGFLSFFLRGGLSGEADEDGDRIVTAGELATYVRRRFRREGDIPATTREDERNFQNLLIERGGVHVDDVVVRLAGGEAPAATAAAQRPARVQALAEAIPVSKRGGSTRK
ncbi:caspase family protein [Sphingosinicella terrae]|uniref:caspase family protein n=1 Tax=Sphingosinicella terrae TaxID=2172047 RepID=UPI000E0DE177|nr:caspase family protein [Sphingosinicella terrae]